MGRDKNVDKNTKKISGFGEMARDICLAGLSGLLGVLSFPPFDTGILGWFCLVPLFFAVRSCGAKKAFWYSYLSGLIFFGGVLSWLVNVTVPGTVILVLVLAVFYGIFGVITSYVFKYSMNIMVLPFAWVVIEYIRANIFTGFPWAILGYSQYKNINLIQIADITGAFGISFVVTSFNAAFFGLFRYPAKRISYLMLSLFLILASSSYGIYRLQNVKVWGSPEISVVQGNIPQQAKWDPAFSEAILKDYTGLTKKAAAGFPDLIVWPETAYPYLFEEEDNPAPEIGSLAAECGVPILTGLVSGQKGFFYNSAVLFGPGGRIAGKYDKTHLVPFGEYIPFSKHLDFLRGYIDKDIGSFGAGKKYKLFPIESARSSKQPDGSVTRITSFYKFGVLICFEDVFPYIARQFVHEGANFLVNITNDAWFGETAAAKQHMQASVFRAAENKVPVVRAANTGISCFIDAYGRVISGVSEGGRETFVRGYAADKVDVIRSRTYYTMYGDNFVYFCGFMLFVILMYENFLSKKE
ncbi:MAG: apolipoprotein N-acyltransferase [Candidatus Omnitrophota bacterium]